MSKFYLLFLLVVLSCDTSVMLESNNDEVQDNSDNVVLNVSEDLLGMWVTPAIDKESTNWVYYELFITESQIQVNHYWKTTDESGEWDTSPENGDSPVVHYYNYIQGDIINQETTIFIQGEIYDYQRVKGKLYITLPDFDFLELDKYSK